MKYLDFNIVSSVLFVEIVIKVGDDYFYMLLEMVDFCQKNSQQPTNSVETILRNHLCTDHTCGLCMCSYLEDLNFCGLTVQAI